MFLRRSLAHISYMYMIFLLLTVRYWRFCPPPSTGPTEKTTAYGPGAKKIRTPFSKSFVRACAFTCLSQEKEDIYKINGKKGWGDDIVKSLIIDCSRNVSLKIPKFQNFISSLILYPIYISVSQFCLQFYSLYWINFGLNLETGFLL